MDAKSEGPDVVGHAADAARRRDGRALVFQSERLGDRGDDRPEDVGLENRRDALQHAAGPLQTHAGIDVLAWQRLELAGGPTRLNWVKTRFQISTSCRRSA